MRCIPDIGVIRLFRTFLTALYNFRIIPANYIAEKSGGVEWLVETDEPTSGEWSPATDPVLEEIVSAFKNGKFEQAIGLAKEANYTLEIKDVKNKG